MRKIVYLMMILFVVLGVEHLYDVYGVRESPVKISQLSDVVADTFENEGIYESECNVEGYFYYGAMYLGEEGSHELLSRLASYIGVNSDYEYTRNRTDTGYESVLVKEGENSRLELKLTTAEYEENENLIGQQQYLGVNLKVTNSVNSGFYYKEKIARGVEKIMEEATIQFYESGNETNRRRKLVDTLDISIKGKTYGYMNLEKQKKIADELIDGANAQYIFDHVERYADDATNDVKDYMDVVQSSANIVDDDVTDSAITNSMITNSASIDTYSLYAYTNEINDYVAIGKDRINLNVVFDYNQTENVTYIHIGSPIVNYDY